MGDSIVNLTPLYRRYEDVDLTSRFERYNNIVSTTFIVHCELTLLSNVETMSVSTSLQRCILVLQRCSLSTTLSQRCFFVGESFPISSFVFPPISCRFHMVVPHVTSIISIVFHLSPLYFLVFWFVCVCVCVCVCASVCV